MVSIPRYSLCTIALGIILAISHLNPEEAISQFHFTGVYGPATRAGRGNFYEELRQAKPTDGIPWIACGDFNVTIQPEDRTNNHNEWWQTLTFANPVSDLGLLNMTMHGGRFTWSNERDLPHMARLDRFLISTEWNQSFPNSIQKRLPNTSSDHCPIQYAVKTHFQKSRFFRFENFWLRSQEFSTMIEEKWNNMRLAQTPPQLHEKMTSLQKEIKEWAANKVGNITKQITVCRDYLGWIDKVKESRSTTDLEKLITCIIKKRYTDLSIMQEDIWKQRAKAHWELDGDKGTKYFHAYASG